MAKFVASRLHLTTSQAWQLHRGIFAAGQIIPSQLRLTFPQGLTIALHEAKLLLFPVFQGRFLHSRALSMLCGLLGDKSYTHGEFALHKHPPARLAREVKSQHRLFREMSKRRRQGQREIPALEARAFFGRRPAQACIFLRKSMRISQNVKLAAHAVCFVRTASLRFLANPLFSPLGEGFCRCGFAGVLCAQGRFGRSTSCIFARKFVHSASRIFAGFRYNFTFIRYNIKKHLQRGCAYPCDMKNPVAPWSLARSTAHGAFCSFGTSTGGISPSPRAMWSQGKANGKLPNEKSSKKPACASTWTRASEPKTAIWRGRT